MEVDSQMASEVPVLKADTEEKADTVNVSHI